MRSTVDPDVVKLFDEALEIDPERPLFENSASETKDFRRRNSPKTGFPDRSLGSRQPLLATNVVFGRSLELILAVLAAEVVRCVFVLCLVLCCALVDFHATHRVDSHRSTP